jgi:hypothetical protein
MATYVAGMEQNSALRQIGESAASASVVTRVHMVTIYEAARFPSKHFECFVTSKTKQISNRIKCGQDSIV